MASKESKELTAPSKEVLDSSKRRFLKLMGLGLATAFFSGSGLLLYRRLREANGVFLLNTDPLMGTVGLENVSSLSPREIGNLVNFAAKPTEETILTLPFPFNPNRIDDQISFIREKSPFEEQPEGSQANNYIRFNGLKKGSVFRAPFNGEFAWTKSTLDNRIVAGVFLQQRIQTGNYLNLSLDSKEEIEIFINLPPVPQNSPIFFSQTKAHVATVSMGQPLFRTLTEDNLTGPDYQIGIVGLLFTPTVYQNDPLFPVLGHYRPLDIHFLFTTDNKFIVIK